MAQNRAKCYYSSAYIDVGAGVIAFLLRKNRAKVISPVCTAWVNGTLQRKTVHFFKQLAPAGQSWAEAGVPGTGARPRALGLGQSHRVQAPGEGARRVGLSEVLLPARSVKC